MARSVSHLLRVLETFNALGIHFVSLSEAIDTATPAGKLVFTVLGAVAELERSLIVERVKAGYAMPAARARFSDAREESWIRRRLPSCASRELAGRRSQPKCG